MTKHSNKDQHLDFLPDREEITARQGFLSNIRFNSCICPEDERSFPTAPPGNPKTYREMRNNPTIALARAASNAPVRACNWSFLGTNERVISFLEDVLLPHKESLTYELLRALDYGWRALEVIYGIEDELLVPLRFKGLNPDLTEILTDVHGNMIGIRQGQTLAFASPSVLFLPQIQPTFDARGIIELGLEKIVYFGYDVEDQNWFGRSKFENIRNEWWNLCNIHQRLGIHIIRSSGIIPILQYPVGQNEDEEGNVIGNDEIAVRILDNLRASGAVALPKNLLSWAESLVQTGVDPTPLMQWSLTFHDVPRGHTQEFTSTIQHFEALLVRGMLLPERAITEGKYGTKAESEVHGDIAISIAEEVNSKLQEVIQQQIVDRLLHWNFGLPPGSVEFVIEPVVSDERQYFRTLFESFLANPRDLKVINTLIDIGNLADQVGLPLQDNWEEQLAAQNDQGSANNVNNLQQEGESDES